jgi:hypothetical protein
VPYIRPLCSKRQQPRAAGQSLLQLIKPRGAGTTPTAGSALRCHQHGGAPLQGPALAAFGVQRCCLASQRRGESCCTNDLYRHTTA